MHVDPALAEKFLRDRFGTSVDGVEALAGGEWSDAFAFSVGGAERVVRFGQHRDDYERDRYASAFANAALPIPAVLEIGEAFDGCYAISERVHGRGLDDLSGAELEAVLPSLFAALDAMRTADSSASSGYGVWKPDGDGESVSWTAAMLAVGADDATHRTSGWRERLDRDPDAAAAFATGLECMTALVPALPAPRELVHADFVNYNVLVEADRVTGILDWGCAMYGDVVYDVANLCFAQAWFPPWAHVDIRGAARSHFGFPDFDERMRCYEIHVGLGTIRYNAFTGRPGDVAVAVKGTLAAVHRGPA